MFSPPEEFGEVIKAKHVRLAFLSFFILRVVSGLILTCNNNSFKCLGKTVS